MLVCMYVRTYVGTETCDAELTLHPTGKDLPPCPCNHLSGSDFCVILFVRLVYNYILVGFAVDKN